MTRRIIVTCGDVNGVGLEAFIKASTQTTSAVQLSLACDAQALKDYIDLCSLDAEVRHGILAVGSAAIQIHDLKKPTPIELGFMRASAGALALEALGFAAKAVISGDADAVVTLPISKEGCRLAGFQFPGQTEFFGSRWGGVPLMILAHHNVRVALATVHIPIRSVAQRLTRDHIVERIGALYKSLVVDFGCNNPRIAVLALNPHAGEHGAIGTEELDVVTPAVEEAQASYKNSKIDGPIPADGFFGFSGYKNYDGILAMYHDQGLVPLKLLSQGGGVNITSGLRYVRTSPDHGTAYDIAGSGKVNEDSTLQAINIADHIVQVRTQ